MKSLAAAARMGVARALLALTTVMTASCLVPDLEFAQNNPPYLDEEAIPEGAAIPFEVESRTCPDGATELLEMDLEQAALDPDGDELFFSWYVNFDPDNIANPDRLNVPSLTIDCVNNPAILPGINTIDVFVMDRPQNGLNLDEAQSTTGDGFVLHVLYVFDVTK